MSKERNPDALIRIEDAIKVLCREKCYPGMFCPDNYCVEMWDEFEDVERVDAVPVVHCRDCKYWKTGEGVNRSKKVKFCTYAIYHSYARRDEDFCSRGERKDGDRHD